MAAPPARQVAARDSLRLTHTTPFSSPAQGAFGLHFPVHNTPHMGEKLGRKQLERKRVEDGERAAAAAPHFRTDAELREVRAFKEAAATALRAAHTDDGGRQLARQRLSRYYMWAQCGEFVFLAV